MNVSDEELIAGCRSGRADAWEALVLRYRRLIYAIPRRAGFDEDLASEIFQQTFAILVRNIDRIKQPGQIKAWLVTTARRETIRAINTRKAENRNLLISDEDHDDQVSAVPDLAPLQDEELLKLETQNRIRNAVDSLDEKCRKLIRLLFYTDPAPSYSIVAEAMGIREGSVGPTRARCLEKTLAKLSD